MNFWNWKLKSKVGNFKELFRKKNEILKIKLKKRNFRKLFENAIFSDYLKIGIEMGFFVKSGF